MSDYDVETYKKDIQPIECDQDYERVARILGTLTNLRSEVRETFDPVVAQAHAAHKEALNARKKHEADLNYLIDRCKDVMIDYRDSIQEEQDEALALAHSLPAVDGISFRTTYTASIDDRKAFLQYVLENWEQWNEVVQFKSAVLNRYARTMRNCGTTIPGFSIQENKSLAIRKGKE